MLSRRHTITGALAVLLLGPVAATPTFTWTAVTWQGQDYMQGNYKDKLWAACLTRDFSWQREELEAMLRDMV